MSYSPQVEVETVSHNNRHKHNPPCFGYWLSSLEDNDYVEYHCKIHPTLTPEEIETFNSFISDLNKGFDNYEITNQSKETLSVIVKWGGEKNIVFLRFWLTMFRFHQEFPEVVKQFCAETKNSSMDEKIRIFTELNNSRQPELNVYRDLTIHGFKRYFGEIQPKRYKDFVTDLQNRIPTSVHDVFLTNK